jgi:hypothetical protein
MENLYNLQAAKKYTGTAVVMTKEGNSFDSEPGLSRFWKMLHRSVILIKRDAREQRSPGGQLDDNSCVERNGVPRCICRAIRRRNLTDASVCPADEDDWDLEEERRLCYVAITRAKSHLILTRRREKPTYWNPCDPIVAKRMPSLFLNPLVSATKTESK